MSGWVMLTGTVGVVTFLFLAPPVLAVVVAGGIAAGALWRLGLEDGS